VGLKEKECLTFKNLKRKITNMAIWGGGRGRTFKFYHNYWVREAELVKAS
jgi:hypothetical protein